MTAAGRPRRKVLPRRPADHPEVVALYLKWRHLPARLVGRARARGLLPHPFQYDDLRAELDFKLLDLARVFDPARGLQFSTLAYAALGREVGRLAAAIRRGGLVGMGRGASVSRVSTHPVSTSDVAAGCDGDVTAALDAALLAAGRDGVADAGEEATAAAYARVRELMADVLTARERRVLVGRFGLNGTGPRTLDDLGADLGVSKEGVRQIAHRAVAALRAAEQCDDRVRGRRAGRGEPVRGAEGDGVSDANDLRAALHAAQRIIDKADQILAKWADHWLLDAVAVAKQLRADHPADDAEPITPDRLAAMGYAMTADGGYGEMRHGDVRLRVCRFAVNGWQFLASGPPGTLQWAVSVMGDIRALLRGLKVPAREHDPSLLANNRVLRADIAPNTDDEF